MSRDADVIQVVVDFWDVPREGVAMYRGEPHYFAAQFDPTLDDYSGTYLLVPIDPAAAAAARAAWTAFVKWRRAFDEGLASADERPRVSDCLADAAAKSDAGNAVRVRANFIWTEDKELLPEAAFKVVWEEIRT